MIYPITPWPALVIKQGGSTILVVADLHLGFEYELSEMGINIPSQTLKIQSKLMKITKKIRPSRLILLGDVKHSVSNISLQEWKELPDFFESILEHVKIVEVIPGNHDGDLTPLTPPSVKILPTHGIVISGKERVGLFHGHTWPGIELLDTDYLVMAHNHPVIRFEDSFGYRTARRAWIKAKVDLEKLRQSMTPHKGRRSKEPKTADQEEDGSFTSGAGRLIIMPAFNDMLGGLQMNGDPSKTLLGPLLRSGCVDIDDAEAYLLDGSFLGTIACLRQLVRSRRKSDS